MKFDVIMKTLVASAAALAIAGCGGGGGSGDDGDGSTPVASLSLSGTAAVGAALADATVTIKCATGGGSGTTSASGAYAVNMPGAALPCIIQVVGSAGGATVTLHSIAAQGTTSGNETSAVANVTPVSEMIVAQLTAGVPDEIFASFDATLATPEAVSTAADAIVTVLKDAGIDLTGIDPLRSTLVAANGSNAGNTFDELLDALAEKIAPEALPLVVTQIASSAATGAGAENLQATVAGGMLAGCPSAVSGKYRTVDYFGRSSTYDVNFKEGKFGIFTITTQEDKPCEFVARGMVGEDEVVWEVAFGPGGVGAYKSHRVGATNPGGIGYVFPVQSHQASTLGGNWSYIESGYLPGDGLLHMGGELKVAADGKMTLCEFGEEFKVCEVDTEADITVAARPDGGFDLVDSAEGVVGQVYGYKAPGGSITLFGTTNAAGTNANDITQTHIVAVRPRTLALPVASSESKYWDLSLTQRGPNQSSRTVTAPAAGVTRIDAVDAATQAVTRSRPDSDRIDVVTYNKYKDGWRVREAGSNDASSWPQLMQLPLPGVGLSISINYVEFEPNVSPHIYSVSVTRP